MSYLTPFQSGAFQSSIVPFHKDISPSGERPEQRILAYELQQPTAGCIAIFHKYSCCTTKRGGIKTNLKSLGVCY